MASGARRLPFAPELAQRVAAWFPGHMAAASREMARRSFKVDAVIEVRDARLPFTTAPMLVDNRGKMGSGAQWSSKPWVLVFNKADLANANMRRRLEALYGLAPSRVGDGVVARFGDGWSAHDEPTATMLQTVEVERRRRPPAAVLFTSAFDDAAVHRLASVLATVAPPRFKTVGSTCLVCGVPNVGKSSLINALRTNYLAGSRAMDGRGEEGQRGGAISEDAARASRRRKRRRGRVAKVGALPGVTRQLSMIQVAEAPSVFIVDSPGVMSPRQIAPGDVETALRLVLVRAVDDSSLDDAPLILAQYALWMLNSEKSGRGASGRLGSARDAAREPKALRYVDEFKLDGPTDDLPTLLRGIATTRKMQLRPGSEEDELRCASLFVKMIRKGELGRLTIDDIPRTARGASGAGKLK